MNDSATADLKSGPNKQRKRTAVDSTKRANSPVALESSTQQEAGEILVVSEDATDEDGLEDANLLDLKYLSKLPFKVAPPPIEGKELCLEIKPNPELNTMTYCVNTRDLSQLRKTEARRLARVAAAVTQAKASTSNSAA